MTLAFYAQLTFIAVSAAMGLTVGDGRFGGSDNAPLDFLLRAWVWPAASDWLIIVLLGVTAAVGAVLISQAYRLTEAALAAPFEYVSMPMAIFWGVTVFGNWPDALGWLGIALIMGGGLYLFWREALSAHRPHIRR